MNSNGNKTEGGTAMLHGLSVFAAVPRGGNGMFNSAWFGILKFDFGILRIGNGNSVKLRKDMWLNKQPLSISHPTIFRVASDPNSLVAQNREDGIRAPHFRRNMQDRELDKLIDLLKVLERASISPHLPDNINGKMRQL
ncbi:hypothetical protein MTR67_047443 [Solanum verrucosum]|uniref:Uncharacterized protein n=1 Tax=Solanum verrucosum TaxID=315347 RepID=A0AAF0UZG2_SOLVR|nr:hypothetical protein MTR67_047443 [Solanum verrucosum]